MADGSTIRKPRAAVVRLRSKIPIVDNIPRSYAMIVRNNIIARLKAMPYFSQWTFSRSKQFQVQPQNLPYIGIYFIDETLSPDGDSNTGEPRFRSVMQLGFSVFVVNNDAEATEDRLDDVYQLITRGLLMDPSLPIDRQAKIQGYIRGRRVHSFGATLDSETPFGELQFSLAIDLGTITWEPLILDPLELIHITTVQGDEHSQQVLSEYDMEIES